MTAPRSPSCQSMWRDHRPPQDHRCALPAGHAEELHTDRRVWWSDQNSRDTLEPREADRSRPVAPPMTAPRMTDMQAEVSWSRIAPGDLTRLRTEFDRARSAESAALARVRRLEERVARDRGLLKRALAVLNGARFDMDDPAPLLTAVALGAALDAALSEEP